MPQDGINIYMSLIDKVSSPLGGIGKKTKAFSKELQELEQKTAAYSKTQDKLSKETTDYRKKLEQANLTVQTAKKEFKQYKDEAHKGALDKAIEEQEEYKRKLRESEAAMKSNYKALGSLMDQQRKAGNQGGSETATLRKKLGDSGILKMLSGSAASAASIVLSSAIGEPEARLVASTIGGALEGAASGALMGSVLGVPGVAAGAAIGGISGLISGGTEIWGARDNAFKSYVQEAAESQLAQRDSDIESGSGIYAERESDLRVFTTLLGDDADAAKRFQTSLIEIGRTPPFSYGTVAALSKDMLGLGLSTDDATKRINSLAEASAALDWSESNVSSVISLLESAQLAGQFDSRIVKSLSKMGVNAYEALAEEFEISQDEVMDQLSNLDVNRAVQAIYDYMGERFSGAAAGLEGTYSGASGILASYEEDMQNAYGEGYNEARNKGLLDQIDWLSGKSGEAQEEANRAIGAWQASLENAKEKYIRKAVDDAMETSDYQKAKAAGDAAEMGRILMQAKVKGMNEYNASDGAQEALAAEKALVDGIRADTAMNEDYWDAGYERGQWFSKGVAAGIADGIELAKKATAIRDAWEAFGDGGNNSYFDTDPGSFAVGLNRVPYDNFPALLHEGERVLTASQSRAEERGGPTVQVTVTGNSFYGSDAAMEDRVAQKVAREVARAVQLGG